MKLVELVLGSLDDFCLCLGSFLDFVCATRTRCHVGVSFEPDISLIMSTPLKSSLIVEHNNASVSQEQTQILY